MVANLPGGATAAYFQFDRVTVDGTVRSAAHTPTPGSDEGILQLQTFLTTWIETGTAEIVDPYGALE